MKTPNFLSELIRRRLENRRASSAVAAESRAIKTTSMNILDVINQLATASGKASSEIVAEYVGGGVHPEIDAAIAKSKVASIAMAAKPLGKLVRQSATPTAKPSPKPAPVAVRPQAKPPITKPAPAAPNRFARDTTQDLAFAVRRNMLTGNDLTEAKAELDRRGVTIHPTGYSITNKTKH